MKTLKILSLLSAIFVLSATFIACSEEDPDEKVKENPQQEDPGNPNQQETPDYTANWLGDWMTYDETEFPPFKSLHTGTITKQENDTNVILIPCSLLDINFLSNIPAKVLSETEAVIDYEYDDPQEVLSFSIHGNIDFNGIDTMWFTFNTERGGQTIANHLTVVKDKGIRGKLEYTVSGTSVVSEGVICEIDNGLTQIYTIDNNVSISFKGTNSGSYVLGYMPELNVASILELIKNTGTSYIENSATFIYEGTEYTMVSGILKISAFSDKQCKGTFNGNAIKSSQLANIDASILSNSVKVSGSIDAVVIK